MSRTILASIKGFSTDADGQGRLCFTVPVTEYENAAYVGSLTHQTLYLTISTEYEVKAQPAPTPAPES